VGTGWGTYPHLLGESLVAELFDSETCLPQAEDMLPLALQMWQRGVRVTPEQAEPVYLRNEVTWKKLPGR
jgi:tRNA threonylcarbamoyladenosine biosynthesis protein TsaB